MSRKTLERVLATPKDLSETPKHDWASVIALYCIGFISKPTGISEELLKECRAAFGSNRGKFEWEEQAIEQVLKVNNYSGSLESEKSFTP